MFSLWISTVTYDSVFLKEKQSQLSPSPCEQWKLTLVVPNNSLFWLHLTLFMINCILNCNSVLYCILWSMLKGWTTPPVEQFTYMWYKIHINPCTVWPPVHTCSYTSQTREEAWLGMCIALPSTYTHIQMPQSVISTGPLCVVDISSWSQSSTSRSLCGMARCSSPHSLRIQQHPAGPSINQRADGGAWPGL